MFGEQVCNSVKDLLYLCAYDALKEEGIFQWHPFKQHLTKEMWICSYYSKTVFQEWKVTYRQTSQGACQTMLVILSHFLQHMQLHQLQVPHPLSIYGNPDVTHWNVKLQRLETFFPPPTFFSCNHCVQVYRRCERLLRATHVSTAGLKRSNSQLSSSTWHRSALFLVMWPTACRFQTPLRFCTTFCHFSTVQNQPQTTWAPSPTPTPAQLFYECFNNVWALKCNKAAIQKYLHIYSLYYNI